MDSSSINSSPRRRNSPRLGVRCRARIRIGKRHYAGFIDNISDGGVKFTTMTPIREAGPVHLIMPDLPPMRGQIRWMESNGAGVCFELKLDSAMLQDWLGARIPCAGRG